MEQRAKENPATAAEVRQILGSSIDEEQVAAILKTGATAAEVMEAFEWLSGDDRLGTDLEHTQRGRVGAVCDLLAKYAEDEEDR